MSSKETTPEIPTNEMMEAAPPSPEAEKAPETPEAAAEALGQEASALTEQVGAEQNRFSNESADVAGHLELSIPERGSMADLNTEAAAVSGEAKADIAAVSQEEDETIASAREELRKSHNRRLTSEIGEALKDEKVRQEFMSDEAETARGEALAAENASGEPDLELDEEFEWEALSNLGGTVEDQVKRQKEKGARTEDDMFDVAMKEAKATKPDVSPEAMLVPDTPPESPAAKTQAMLNKLKEANRDIALGAGTTGVEAAGLGLASSPAELAKTVQEIEQRKAASAKQEEDAIIDSAREELRKSHNRRLTSEIGEALKDEKVRQEFMSDEAETARGEALAAENASGEPDLELDEEFEWEALSNLGGTVEDQVNRQKDEANAAEKAGDEVTEIQDEDMIEEREITSDMVPETVYELTKRKEKPETTEARASKDRKDDRANKSTASAAPTDSYRPFIGTGTQRGGAAETKKGGSFKAALGKFWNGLKKFADMTWSNLKGMFKK